MHPYGVAREPCPPPHSLHSEVAAVRVLILSIVDVASLTVEPVLGYRSCLYGITEDGSVIHLLVAEGEGEHEHASPRLHRLARRLLSVAVALVTHTSCERVSAVRVEGAQPRIMAVVALVACIVHCQLACHGSVLLTKIVIEHTEDGGSIGEVTVVEMVVVEGLGVVRGVEPDECSEAREACEIAVLLARGVAQPIHQGVSEPLLGLEIDGGVACLKSESHVVHHLRQSLASPISVGTEAAFLCIVGCKRVHQRGRVALCPLGGSGKEWQEVVDRIGEAEAVTLSQSHRAAR